jgi:hypothetical protein
LQKRRTLAFAGLLLLLACTGSALALASTGHKSKRGVVHNSALARRYGVLRRASTSVTQLPDDVASSAQMIAPGMKAADGRLAGGGSDGWSVWAAPTKQGGLCVFNEDQEHHIGGACNTAANTADGVVLTQPAANGTDVTALIPDGAQGTVVTTTSGGTTPANVVNNGFHVRVPGATVSITYHDRNGAQHTLEAEAGDAH